MRDRRVKDVMTHLVVMLYPTDTLHEAALRLARNHISGAPVVENGRVVGVVSEADLVHAAIHLGGDQAGDKKVTDVMSSVVFQVTPETSIWKAAAIMERRGVKRLPVVDDEGYLLGIISRADLVKAMAEYAGPGDALSA